MIHVEGNASTEVSGIKNGDVQPNAVDLRVANISRLKCGTFKLEENKKENLTGETVELKSNGFYVLSEGVYTVTFSNTIAIPEGEAGFVIPRSTLVRNGVILTTGLYDSGYRGPMVACMHVTIGTFMLEQNARIAQYLCFSAETLHLYNGYYQLGKKV